MKSMHLFPGCGARNGVRPISLRGTAPARPLGASSCSRCSPRRPCRGGESLEWVLPRRPLIRTGAGRLEDAGPCGRRAAARASEPLSAQQATGPHTELRVAGRAPRPRSLPQLQRIREHVQPPGKGAEEEASGASRSALASASGVTGIPRLLRWTRTVPADVSRRRVTGHGQSTASTQPLRITTRRKFAVWDGPSRGDGSGFLGSGLRGQKPPPTRRLPGQPRACASFRCAPWTSASCS